VIFDVLKSAATYLVIYALVWGYAWVVNPDLSSGTVSFIGLVAGTVANFARN
jgi:hypothetical protein